METMLKQVMLSGAGDWLKPKRVFFLNVDELEATEAIHEFLNHTK